MKEFTENNLKFDENSRKFSESVENIGKRRNCLLQPISPIQSFFQKTCTAET